MATVHYDAKMDQQLAATHPAWSRAFSFRQREEMTQEDLHAGSQIPAILMAIMVFGFVSMVVSVWLAI